MPWRKQLGVKNENCDQGLQIELSNIADKALDAEDRKNYKILIKNTSLHRILSKTDTTLFILSI